MTGEVTARVEDGAALLTIANPPVNALARPVRVALLEALETALDDPEVAVIVLMAEGGTFPSASDPDEFGRDAAPGLAELCATIEDSPKPVVAALHGSVFESGLALAVACHYRVCGSRVRFGAPEVAVGLVPGGGLTQRLPRLIGVGPALDLMISGQAITAVQAKALGLVDEVVPARVAPAAHDFARDVVTEGWGPRRTCDMDTQLRAGQDAFDEIRRRRQGLRNSPLETPARIVDCVEASLLMPFVVGVAREQAAIEDCLGSAQTAALRHAFFAERRVASARDFDPAQAREVRSIGVAGTQPFALGIAIAALDHGIAVQLVGSDADRLVHAEHRITASYMRAVQQGQLTAEARDQRLDLFEASNDLATLAEVDLVIEAAAGPPDRRAAILARIEANLPRDITLATTSDAGFEILAASLDAPERLVGLHFFAPAQVVRAVELVRLPQTGEVHLATAHRLARRLGKVPVSVGPGEGLVANRLQLVMFSAADVLMLMGARPGQIDAAMRRHGFGIGPCAAMDALGLAHLPGACVRELVDAGRPGGAAGGFFDADRPGEDSVEVLDLLDALRRSAGIPSRDIPDSEIRERIICAMANEGARLIDAGRVPRPIEIDVVMMLAKGYPRWQGGPMKQADLAGVLQIRNRLRDFAQDARDLWEPADMWQRLLREARALDTLNET